jgi:histidinol-phosphatase (PHP family)
VRTPDGTSINKELTQRRKGHKEEFDAPLGFPPVKQRGIYWIPASAGMTPCTNIGYAMIDLHTHPSPWRTSWQAFRQFAHQAWKQKLKVLGISEHAPRQNPRVPWRSLYFNELDRYFQTIEEIRMEFNGELEVLRGLEVDYHAPIVGIIGPLIDRYPLDYVVGSVHFVDDWIIDDPETLQKEPYRSCSPEDLAEMYLRRLEGAAQCGLFQVMAHVDYMKKCWGAIGGKPRIWDTRIRDVMRIFRETGVAVELNTRGWALPEVNDSYPSRETLELLFASGIPITIGSDAHVLERVGDRVDMAAKILYEIGYRELTIFRNRVPITLPLVSELFV